MKSSHVQRAFGKDHHGIRGVLHDSSALNEREFGTYLIFVERFGPKKIKIDRTPMSQMKGDRSSPIQDKAKLWSGCKRIPDLLLHRWQNVTARRGSPPRGSPNVPYNPRWQREG